MKIVWMGVEGLRRTLRVRSNLFYMVVMPLLLVYLLGQGSRLGVQASSLLLMFVFFMPLIIALALQQALRSGVIARIRATPTSTAEIVLGEAFGQVLIALFQGLVIMVGSSLLFGARWGHPVPAAALLVLFVLVGAGAAMLIGSSFKGEGMVFGLAMVLGLGLPTLGGSLFPPLERMAEPLRTFAHLTPHAWGHKGFTAVLSGGNPWPPIGVLAVFAAVLMAAGIWQFHRRVSR
ncbi:ABC transporter permease [Nonomuraea sp. NPDC050663]|uniref:ABC transporter permease n=1 Tax=Nonomuraea sp. NPDC050663 TaxID=3364370 RepID=UPI0037B8BF65